MPRKKPRNDGFLVLLVLSIVIASVAGFYAVEKRNQARQQEIARLEQLERERQKREELGRNFETLLNGFIRDIAQDMVAYKKKRRVLREIIKPWNFEDPVYAQENFDIFVDQIAPALRKAAIDVLDNFSRTESHVIALLAQEPEDTREVVLAQWNVMKEEQSAIYMRFFEIENELLEAYGDLLKFYFIHANQFTFDPDSGEIVFEKVQDKETERRLLDQIDVIKRKHKSMQDEAGD